MAQILEKAMKRLSEIVNRPDGLSHNIDNSRAKELLVALHKRGIQLSDIEVFELAKSNKWSESHATKLSRLAKKIGEGGGVVISDPSDNDWGNKVAEEIVQSQD